jgi:hypothetical protein
MTKTLVERLHNACGNGTDCQCTLQDAIREITQLRGNLSLAEEGLASAMQEIAMLKGPGNATQAQLDAATKPLHTEIERLRAGIEKMTFTCCGMLIPEEEPCHGCKALRGLLAGAPAEPPVQLPKNWAVWQCLVHLRIFAAHAGCSYCREGRAPTHDCNGTALKSGERTYPDYPVAGIYEAGLGIVRLGTDDEATGE